MSRRSSKTLATLVVGGLVALGACLGPSPAAQARSLSDLFGGQQDAAVSLSALPAEAQDTHKRILAGGPFRYPGKDGSVFGNRERQLPRQARGYYKEYTVPTPGSRDRGARRIICGGREPTTPDVCYYTQDHYASFRRIAP